MFRKIDFRILYFAACLLIGFVGSVFAEKETISGGDGKINSAEKKFLTSCAGCHTIGGGNLNGPELSASAKWPMLELKNAIKRMEKNSGALTDEDIQALADLIRDPQAIQRIQVEEAKIAQMFAAKMDPPSAEIGRALFEGRKPLKNGGLACSACHMMGSGGEILGPDLFQIHSKMGEVALASAIEKSSFKIMNATYRLYPITKQEALHMARYLSQKDPVHTSMAVSMPLKVGVVSAVVLLASMMIFYRPSKGVTHPILKRRKK